MHFVTMANWFFFFFFLCLVKNGKLVRFEPDTPLADMLQVIANHPQDVGAHRKIYLVESSGNIYGVFL